jgi:hypothetical protein
MYQAAKVLGGPGHSYDSILPPEGEAYPKKIVQSPNFMEKQKEVWKLLLADSDSAFLQSVFPSPEQVHDKFFGTESDEKGEASICVHERFGILSSVMTLARQVLGDRALKQAVAVGGDIAYGSAHEDFAAGALNGPTIEDDTSNDAQDGGFSVFANTENRRPIPAVVVEYRPPNSFRLCRAMTVSLEHGIVPERDVIGQEEEGITFDYSPKRVITAIITQAFHHMVKAGVPYGYIYTPDAIIFLEIQSDPSVLHYFISFPSSDVTAQDESIKNYSAVSQIFTFLIRAMQAGPTSMSWNDKAANLDVWKSNFKVREYVVDQIVVLPPLRWHLQSYPCVSYGDNKKKVDSDAGDSENDWDSEQYDRCDIDIDDETSMTIEIGMDATLMEEDLEPLTSNQQQDQMQDQILQADQHVQSEGQEDKENKREVQEDKQASGDNDDDDDQVLWIKNDRTTSSDIRKREYCTQECLLGLTSGEPLDQACPNFHLHGDKHIDHIQFLDLVQRQVSEADGPSVDCLPLDLCGSMGTLFKVTLSSYGYTVVAKGVVEDNSLRLCREGRMYSQLKEIQGSCIPVYLGIAKLDLPYMYKGGAFTHFMFLSWAGLPLKGLWNQRELNRFSGSVYRAYGELHQAGLLHRDAELRNMLYNSQQGRIMLVDFKNSDFYPCRLAGFDADGNDDMTKQEGDGDCSGDGSSSESESESDSSTNECLRSVHESECLRNEFEDACNRERKHAVNLVDCLIWDLEC